MGTENWNISAKVILIPLSPSTMKLVEYWRLNEENWVYPFVTSTVACVDEFIFYTYSNPYFSPSIGIGVFPRSVEILLVGRLFGE